MSEISDMRLTGNPLTFAGALDLTDHDHDILIYVFENFIDAQPHDAHDALHASLRSLRSVRALALTQGWPESSAAVLENVAAEIYATILRDAVTEVAKRRSTRRSSNR